MKIKNKWLTHTDTQVTQCI